MTDHAQIIGLGYVGLTLGVYLSNKGVKVHGVDISDTILDCLNQRKAHFFEEDFDRHLVQAIDSGNFTFGKNWISSSSPTAHIVTVGTPLGDDKLVNLDPIRSVLKILKQHLREQDIVILRSTVRVGVTRDVVKKELDQCEKPYYLGFCPERTLEGSALEELASLPQVISGIDQSSLEKIKSFFDQIAAETVSMDSVEEAEIVKLINNSERDLSFALANEIALMCDAKGLNAALVIKAVNHKYSRSNIKRPGPSGGPCLSKDPYILTEGFLSGSYVPKLFAVGRAINEDMIEISLKRLFNGFSTDPKKITILGFAFKGSPPTGDMRGSLVHPVLHLLKERYPNAEIVGHDYLADPEEMHRTGVTVEKDITKAVRKADLVILQNNHPQYSQELWKELREKMNPEAFVFDFWNQLPKSLYQLITNYVGVGNMGGSYV